MKKNINRLFLASVSLICFIACEKEVFKNQEEAEEKGPQITTLDAEKGQYQVVTLSGKIIGLNEVAENFECGIEYSSSNGEDKIKLKSNIKYSGESFSITLNGIKEKKIYYYRAYCLNGLDAYYGETKSFQFEWDALELETVDLGLSVNWASYNIGAKAPWGAGNYYAWGETETKDTYNWSTYKYCDGSNITLTKYCYQSEYGKNGFTDNKIILEPADDIARVKLGGIWRIPSNIELLELMNNCTWLWTTVNGVNGYKITSNIEGFKEKSIFLPVTGWNNIKSNYVGYYHSNTLSDVSSYSTLTLYIYPSIDDYKIVNTNREEGYAVRPVCTSNTWKGITSIKLESDSLVIAVDGYRQLNVELKSGNIDYSFFDGISWSSTNESVAIVDANGKVTAISEGKAIIYATINGLTAKCPIRVVDCYSPMGYEGEYGYIDLGLSVKWATHNIGTERVDGYGAKYAWGETSTKSNYYWDNYKYCKESSDKLTKYCSNSNKGYNGFTDGKTTLEMVDDVAHVIWKNNWRMPTSSEFSELIENCEITKTTINGVKGWKFASKIIGFEGNSLFLPLYKPSLGNPSGYYWSSTRDPVYQDEAKVLFLWQELDGYYPNGYGVISNGRSSAGVVRPVCP